MLVLIRAALIVAYLTPRWKRAFWRWVYEFLARRPGAEHWTFMNYGYQPGEGDESANLGEDDEPNRACIALYHRAAGDVNLVGKDVLEVGSGRGGGASYISRYLQPKSVVGVDFSDQAVAFCRERHEVPGLSFEQGDAEALPFEDASFDVVVNVESSHCYGSVAKFYSEAARVLRPGGTLVTCDFRPVEEIDTLRSLLREAALAFVRDDDITPRVLAALDSESANKEALVAQVMSANVADAAREFAAVKGSEIYEKLRSGKWRYFAFTLKKA